METYIEKCILSIINQTHTNLEIILINDGSTDSSGKICDEFAKRDNRIKVYHILNGGSSIARNYGLSRCKGDYIGFVDSDDWIKPNMFEDLIAFAAINNLDVVECSSIDSIFENQPVKKINKGVVEQQSEAIKRIIKYRRFAVWRRIYKSSLVKNRFFLEHILHQDVYFTIDILNEVDAIGFIDYPYYIYNRENTDSVIRSKYSLKKLNSINAAPYVLENTTQYDSETISLAKDYLFKFLTSHYNSLFEYHELDPDFQHREKIKQTIIKHLSITDFDFYSVILALLPPKLYEIFLHTNKTRIQAQVKFIEKFRNVKS